MTLKFNRFLKNKNDKVILRWLKDYKYRKKYLKTKELLRIVK